MLHLFRYLKGYRKESILGPLFKFFEAALELFVPLVVASFIDVGIGEKNTSHSIRMFFLLIVLAVVGLGFSLTAQYFAAKAAVGFVKKIRQALFAHMNTLSYTEIDRLTSSGMITLLTSDMNQIQSGMNMSLRLLLRSPFVVGGAYLMTWIIDPKVSRVFGLTILTLTGVVFGIIFITLPLYRQVQRKLNKVLLASRENLMGIRVVRAFGLEKKEKEEFSKKQGELTKAQRFVGDISSLLNPLSYLVINLGTAFLIWKGAIRVEHGILTQGAVVALYNYMAQILEELVKLANTIILLTKMIASGNRVQEVFEISPSQEYPQETSCEKEENLPFLVFDHVSFRYEKAGEDALKNISFTANKGEVIGIIGGTGSGKTSLVQLIGRFYDASSGQILLGGKDVRKYTKEDLRSKISMVPQKAVLFLGTIRENLLWGNEKAEEEDLWEALTIAQAREFVEKKEEGLEFMIAQNGRNLSGGQKQRLTIARALVGKTEILILDDSSSALDYTTDAALRKALETRKKETLILLVSQRTLSIQKADKILVLEDGELAGTGTHEELLDSCNTYQEIYASQFKKEVQES